MGEALAPLPTRPIIGHEFPCPNFALLRLFKSRWLMAITTYVPSFDHNIFTRSIDTRVNKHIGVSPPEGKPLFCYYIPLKYYFNVKVHIRMRPHVRVAEASARVLFAH